MTSFVRGVAVTKTARQVALRTFSRKCAMLVFNVVPSPDNALSFDRLYGTSLVIRNISSSGAVLLAGTDTGILPTGGGIGVDAGVTSTFIIRLLSLFFTSRVKMYRLPSSKEIFWSIVALRVAASLSLTTVISTSKGWLSLGRTTPFVLFRPQFSGSEPGSTGSRHSLSRP